MRVVRNIVDTGRTITCTVHQPSIDIFEVAQRACHALRPLTHVPRATSACPHLPVCGSFLAVTLLDGSQRGDVLGPCAGL